MNHRFALALGGLLFFFSFDASAEVELAYDDGVANGTLRDLQVDDIELTRMTPEHPAELISVQLYFASGGCRARVFVWGDNGGNAADVEQVFYETEVDVEAEGWLELELPAGAVMLNPPQHFYVGHILTGDPTCRLSWDGSGSDEPRSLARISGGWYTIIDGLEPPRAIDALIRATVRYFDIIEDGDFEEVTEAAGLPAGMSRMAWGDFDDDGDDDLLVNGNRLFRNESDGTFAEVTEAAGIGDRPTNGGLWADYDNDGHLDFYATVSSYLPTCTRDEDCLYCTLRSNPDGSRECDQMQYDYECVDGHCTPPSGEQRHDLLWHNEGDGTFSEVSEEAGVFDFLPTEAAAWADYDGDGFVDLYVANYETPGSWVNGVIGRGTPDILWHNEGDGTFRDVSDDAGIYPFAYHQCGRGVSWVDFDLDGDQDLFVVNYRLDFNYFFENTGDGAFEYIGHDNGTAGVNIGGNYGHSIGATWGDVENDGDWDLFIANLAHPRFIEFSDKSMLYINGGGPQFAFDDARESAGITFSETHSNPAFGDYDNDGFIDLFITDIYVGYRSFLYRNNGDVTFTDVTYPSGVNVDNGWGAAWADYDRDGRLDLVTRTLWHNQTPNAGHWLEVQLRGTDSNRSAIGAIVTVTAAHSMMELGRTMMRQVEGGSGTGVQSSMTLHFGLGDATSIEEVTIRWPSGLVESYDDVDIDQVVLWREGDEPPEGDGGPDGGPDGGSDGGVDAGPGGGDLALRWAIGGPGCSCAVGSDAGAQGRSLLALLVLLAAGALVLRRRPS